MAGSRVIVAAAFFWAYQFVKALALIAASWSARRASAVSSARP